MLSNSAKQGNRHATIFSGMTQPKIKISSLCSELYFRTKPSCLVEAPRSMKIHTRVQRAKESRGQVKGMEFNTLETLNP